ncbi:hypothetical protein [Bacillus sp. FJAT-47783]|uniref:hypothetical protein n=1 Tax=Bacillus sp. FJAT-47783 TaxID=2922712 RepID=UPI001FAB85E2|nr:hypothetical protein [Bacillus sp. FJAT-47783]
MKRMLLLIIGVLMLVQFRYKVLNVLLGMKVVRQFFISLAIKMPFLKDKFMHNAFRFQP